jgi:hypothetical protein
MTDLDSVSRARRRLADLKGFYIHLFIFAAVVGGLFLVNVGTGGAWWVQWVFFGWGIGMVAHAIATFWRTPTFISQWERRKLRQLMGRSQ